MPSNDKRKQNKATLVASLRVAIQFSRTPYGIRGEQDLTANSFNLILNTLK